MNDKITRRECGQMLAAGLAGLFIPSVFSSCSSSSYIPSSLKGTPAAAAAAKLGIVLGAQTYSFREYPLDEAIKAMQQLGISSCELWEGHVYPRHLRWEPGQTKETAERKRQELLQWRQKVDYAAVEDIKEKFASAGISIIAYTSTIKDHSLDAEVDTDFKVAKALGVDTINSSATVSAMKRIDAFARKYKIKVGMHNHSQTEKPNEISSPQSFAEGMKGLSDYININLDIGHFTAANFDAVAFLKENHKKVLSIHLKDRKKNQGANLPFGEGDTPIAEVLNLIRDNKWPIPANIEYEYKGGDAIVEVRKCLAYCKGTLKQNS